MFLNCLDICVCFTALMQQIMRQSSEMAAFWVIIQGILESLYMVSIEGTGFTTLLLSVTRCLSVSLPWYNIKGFYVAMSAVLFISYATVREISFWIIMLTDINHYNPKVHVALNLGGIGLMIILVLVSNFISIMNITKIANINERSRETGFQATVTVAILSAVFSLLNISHVLSVVIHFYYLGQNIILKFGIFYAVPLNSALNPLIYFLRNKEMRQSFVNAVKFFMTCGQNQPNEVTQLSPLGATVITCTDGIQNQEMGEMSRNMTKSSPVTETEI